MCINLIQDADNCKLKMRFPDGHRYNPQIAAQINQTFKTLAQERDINKQSLLGYACGGDKCCYIYNEFVALKDCPYYNVQ